MIKFNNQVSLKLTEIETNFLINLMNEKFEINTISDAIRYCIRKELFKQDNKKTE